MDRSWGSVDVGCRLPANFRYLLGTKVYNNMLQNTQICARSPDFLGGGRDFISKGAPPYTVTPFP